MQQQNLTRAELKCKSCVFLLSPPEMPHFLVLPKSRDASSKESSATLGFWDPQGSLRPDCTIGKAFWAIPPSVAVTPYLESANQSISAPSEALTDWELGTGRRVRKASSIRTICFNVGYFRFKMCLNYHLRLIPATWIALYSAIDLIISATSFLLLWVLSEKKPQQQKKKKTQAIYCSPLSAVTGWTYFPQYLY